MRILLVEDEERAVEAFKMALSAVGVAEYSLAVARDRDTALRYIAEEPYDYVVCDVWIPADSASPKAEREHGIRVFEEVQAKAPGTPCVFLTGQPAHDLETRQRLERGPLEDIYGIHEMAPLVALRTKAEVLECARLLASAAGHLRALEDLPVCVDGGPLSCTEERVLQIVTRRYGGAGARVARLSGLSGAGAFRVEIYAANDRRIARLFAKVGDFDRILKEDERYRLFVPAQLPNGTFAARADAVLAGAGDRAGLFFTVADGFDESLLECLTADVPRSVRVIRRVWSHLAVWTEAAVPRSVTVGELRRQNLGDDVLSGLPEELRGAVQSDVEGLAFEMPHWPQHGDLHGGNVLVRGEEPLLIDFADAGVRPGGYDAVALELSLLFHPDSPFIESGWPTVESAGSWWHVDEFVDESPAAEFIQACRLHALDAVGEVGVAAIGYAHAVRQLKYPDTRKDLAVAVARSAADRLHSELADA